MRDQKAQARTIQDVCAPANDLRSMGACGDGNRTERTKYTCASTKHEQ